MRNLVVATGAVLALALAIVSAPATHAQPGFPASFHGAVAIDGKPVPDGTEVRGFINGVDCTQLGQNYRTTVTVDGVSQYAIEVVHESQKDGCGDDGREVIFTVGGVPARETAEWKPGVTVVNLNVGAGTGPTLAPATATPTPNATEAAATATEVAQFTPATGTPPTDEVSPPGTTPRATATTAPSDTGDAEETGTALPLIGAVIVGLLLLGAVGGTLLARRRSGKVREP